MPESGSVFKSYSSRPGGALRSAFEVRELVKHHRRDLQSRVAAEISLLDTAGASIEEKLGIHLEGLRMLDVGAGQRLMQMTYFALRGNEVVGIDRDLVVRGYRPWDYVRMAQSNGLKRVAKTLARKTLGIDRAYHRELLNQLGSSGSASRQTVRQMDAGRMDFDDGSFDFVYSFRVFQHVEDPIRVAREMARVVAPGGAAYAAFLPYTATNGCLDLRMLSGRAGELPPWPHLQKVSRDTVEESAYLNRLRVDEWRALFSDAMPGCELEVVQSTSAELRRMAEELRASGELSDYSLEELLAVDARVFWRRPVERP